MKTSAPRGFGPRRDWVFDLDNTLYPHHLNLWQQVDERIRLYIERLLKLSPDDAFRLQKDYYKRYGTTCAAVLEHGMEPDDFLEFVHQIDHSPLQPNPSSAPRFRCCPAASLILTNGTRAHADMVTQRLGIHDHFENVFDIVAAELEPKPSPQTYDRFLAATVSIPKRRRCLRIWRAISRRRIPSHDHRAGIPEGAREIIARPGNWKAVSRPCRLRH